MTETEVHEVALKYIAESDFASGSIVSIRRLPRLAISDPVTLGDEWVVQYLFDIEDDDFVDSPGIALIIVDDATGTPHPFDVL